MGLGNALETLGERESGTARLEEAVAAYGAALEERTRDRGTTSAPGRTTCATASSRCRRRTSRKHDRVMTPPALALRRSHGGRSSETSISMGSHN